MLIGSIYSDLLEFVADELFASSILLSWINDALNWSSYFISVKFLAYEISGSFSLPLEFVTDEPWFNSNCASFFEAEKIESTCSVVLEFYADEFCGKSF